MINVYVLSGAFLLSVFLARIIIPNILIISLRKRLFDQPDERKVHNRPIPRLGGVTFFPVILFTFAVFTAIRVMDNSIPNVFFSTNTASEFMFLIAGLTLLYIIGIADDLIGVRYRKKFVVQIISASFFPVSGLFINDFYGLFGIGYIPPFIGIPLTILLVVFITNSINLIDGIDGLASGISMVVLTLFGVIFIHYELWNFAILAFIGVGVIIPFFAYNVFGNAEKGRKIFMGDTGSLTLGYIISFFVIKYCMYVPAQDMDAYGAPVVVSFGMLLVPCLDVIRVVLKRARTHKPIFMPDKNHIHHKFLAMGMSPRKALATIQIMSAAFFAFSFIAVRFIDNTLVFVIDVIVWTLLNLLFNSIIKKKQQKTKLLILVALLTTATAEAQKNQTGIGYHIQAEATAASGDYAPYWLTANRYGLGSTSPNSFYTLAGIDWAKNYNYGWKLSAGLDLVAGAKHATDFRIHQAYFDISWKKLNLSIGSKARISSPLDKNPLLTSGWMTEGMNTVPVPQIRAEIPRFLEIPFLGNWLALKGHLAYGMFTDDKWQEEFASPGAYYTRDVKYHSKALMFRLGKKEKFPLEFEFGLHMATQFCGDRMLKHEDGSSTVEVDMPDGIKNYFNAFFPTSGSESTEWGEQVNVEGNMLGSWNFALNYYYGDWKFRAWLDHYFEDHSQMFWEYGRWKDGQLGIEVTLPRNRWLTSVLWEGISTKDQTGPVLYDGFAGSFGDLQMSGCDNYFNHYIYNSWQHYGMGMGSPLIPGPGYNKDGSMSFRSTRMKAVHFGLSGNPSAEWSWRMLFSHASHWGNYHAALDKVRKQFNSLAEVSYTPARYSKWTFKAAFAVDSGNYLGNTAGGNIGVKLSL